jgi:hypothetical protein
MCVGWPRPQPFFVGSLSVLLFRAAFFSTRSADFYGRLRSHFSKYANEHAGSFLRSVFELSFQLFAVLAFINYAE